MINNQSHRQIEQFVALEYPHTQIWKMLKMIIITVTLISIMIQVTASIGTVWQNFSSQLFTINLVIASILALDRFYRYLCSVDQVWFIFNFFSLVELWSFFPFFILMIGANIPVTLIEFLSTIWKLCMIVRLLRYFKILNHLHKAVRSNRYKYEIALILLISIRAMSGLIIHYIESGTNHQFDSIPASLRWSIVTMSTVWYGDLVPQTILGKLIGWLVIFFWPVFLGIISSITVVTFLDMVKYHHKYQELSQCPRCFNKSNDIDARYCKICWSTLDHHHTSSSDINTSITS